VTALPLFTLNTGYATDRVDKPNGPIHLNEIRSWSSTLRFAWKTLEQHCEQLSRTAPMQVYLYFSEAQVRQVLSFKYIAAGVLILS